MNWLEVFGWIGSGAVIFSLILDSRKQFRWWNFIGCVLATIYNGLISVWPFFAMNLVISLIDAYWIWRIYQEERSIIKAEGDPSAATCHCPNCGHDLTVTVAEPTV